MCLYLEMMCYLLHGPFALVGLDYSDAGQSATSISCVGVRRVGLWGVLPKGSEPLRSLIEMLGVDRCGAISGNCAFRGCSSESECPQSPIAADAMPKTHCPFTALHVDELTHAAPCISACKEAGCCPSPRGA